MMRTINRRISTRERDKFVRAVRKEMKKRGFDKANERTEKSTHITWQDLMVVVR